MCLREAMQLCVICASIDRPWMREGWVTWTCGCTALQPVRHSPVIACAVGKWDVQWQHNGTPLLTQWPPCQRKQITGTRIHERKITQNNAADCLEASRFVPPNQDVQEHSDRWERFAFVTFQSWWGESAKAGLPISLVPGWYTLLWQAVCTLCLSR